MQYRAPYTTPRPIHNTMPPTYNIVLHIERIVHMSHLTGKVALVTGAGSGIGKAAAVLFAQHGANVVALAHTPDEVTKTVEEIKSNGGDAITAVADTRNEDEVKKAVQQAIDRWGHLDIVFANAGINGVWAPIEEFTLEEWSRTIDTNLTGTFLTIKTAVPHLKKQGGSIVAPRRSMAPASLATVARPPIRPPKQRRLP